MVDPWNAGSITEFLIEVPSNTIISILAGTVFPVQLNAHDHLFPSPKFPPHVPSVPSPSHVLVSESIQGPKSPPLYVKGLASMDVKQLRDEPEFIVKAPLTVKTFVPVRFPFRVIGPVEVGLLPSGKVQSELIVLV